MKIKVNDKVQVTTGKDKGKTGKVIQILPEMKKIVVEGINVMYKHIRSQKKGEKGQRIQFNGPLDLSNIMLICPKCNKASKVGVKLGENRKAKARFCKKCKEVID
ncbi:50S ribosomal protein L24 [Patescibacteria group bacterium]|nr:50S ribosomal protein L24 [Patescibacteria group bacterium]